MTLASQVGKPGAERASPLLKVAQQGSAGWDRVLVFQPPTWRRHTGLLLSSAPPGSHLHVLHIPITPGWLRGQGSLPSRLQGFRLKSALSRLWASTLRNCGMPSLALKSSHILGEEGQAEGGPEFAPVLWVSAVSIHREIQSNQ